MLNNKLQLAKVLDLPSRHAMLHRAPSVHYFWSKNRELLVDAWKEWDSSEQAGEAPFANDLLDPSLRDAVNEAWKNPDKEINVRNLWKELSPGVYSCQFFDPKKLVKLREYLESVWAAQIPLRPPYGIVLNRSGVMLDQRSEGFLAAPSFQDFYRDLIDTYMRPISRLLFPEIVGYDSQSFGFSIHYRPDTDTSIRPHTDVSSVTLNINLNLPGEEFTGSGINFYDPSGGESIELGFTPGSAMLHRGNIPHAAAPILSGERTNFVLWLYGERGNLPPQGANGSMIEAKQRWIHSTFQLDSFAPF